MRIASRCVPALNRIARIAGERFVCIHGKSVEAAEQRHCLTSESGNKLSNSAFLAGLSSFALRVSRRTAKSTFAEAGSHRELIVRPQRFGPLPFPEPFRRPTCWAVIAVGWTWCSCDILRSNNLSTKLLGYINSFFLVLFGANHRAASCFRISRPRSALKYLLEPLPLGHCSSRPDRLGIRSPPGASGDSGLGAAVLEDRSCYLPPLEWSRLQKRI
jgi:hypothetical protein